MFPFLTYYFEQLYWEINPPTDIAFVSYKNDILDVVSMAAALGSDDGY